MNQPEIFSATIGLSLPWEMTAVAVSKVGKRFDFSVEFSSNCSFACPCCGVMGKPDVVACETWLNNNYLGHIAYLHARVPCIVCKCCGTKLVDLPWARPGSGFKRITRYTGPHGTSEGDFNRTSETARIYTE